MDLSNLRTARPVAKLQAGRSDWYRIENKASGVSDVYIYDEIGYFGVTAQDFVKDLGGITAPQIVLHLNTPGGDVFDGLAIYNSLKAHPAKVRSVVEGIAASAGSFIAMAGDEVVVMRNAQMMIHDAMGLCIGNANDMQAMVDLLAKNSDNIADIYAQRAGGTVEEWRTKMQAETWYSAEEAVAAGLADKVGGGDSTENKFDLSIFNYKGRESAPAPIIENSEDDFADLAEQLKALKEAFQ
jgi:ATP-dependent Clp endopeptidase proteolytic subunit ClpP